MATAPPIPEFKRLTRKVARFDAVVAVFSSLSLMLAIGAVFLGAAWLSNAVWNPPRTPIKLDMVAGLAEGEAGEEGMAGENPELGEGDASAPDSVSALDENLANESSGIASTLTSVLDAVGQGEGVLDAPLMQSGFQGSGTGGLPGGSGLRGAGEGGGGAIPRALRWSIVFGGNQSIDNYAQILDFFKIELGVIKSGDRATYISGFSTAKPAIDKGRAAENRLFFQWREPARKEADMQLLRRAGVSTDNATVVQFFPADLEEKLAALEKSYRGKDAKEIAQTRFGVRPSADGYEFYVLNQTYSKDPQAE